MNFVRVCPVFSFVVKMLQAQIPQGRRGRASSKAVGQGEKQIATATLPHRGRSGGTCDPRRGLLFSRSSCLAFSPYSAPRSAARQSLRGGVYVCAFFFFFHALSFLSFWRMWCCCSTIFLLCIYSPSCRCSICSVKEIDRFLRLSPGITSGAVDRRRHERVWGEIGTVAGSK